MSGNIQNVAMCDRLTVDLADHQTSNKIRNAEKGRGQPARGNMSSSGQRGPDVVVENDDEDEGEVVKPAWKDLLDGELHESLYKIGLEGVCVGVVFRCSAFRTAPKSSTTTHRNTRGDTTPRTHPIAPLRHPPRFPCCGFIVRSGMGPI
jgi:hypothetical protein